MTDLPLLTVIIPTFNRHELVKGTVASLKKNLHYAGEIVYMISADGEPLPLDSFDGAEDVIILTGPSEGFGKNLNHLMHNARSQFIFQQDDDLFLLEPMDVTRYVVKLQEDETAGWIRLWGVGYHDLTANLDGEYWRVSWNSREHYICSMRPHIKHRRFHDYFGFFPEGLKIGETEEAYNHIVKRKFEEKGNGPSLLVPLSGLGFDSIYHHMGVESLRMQGF